MRKWEAGMLCGVVLLHVAVGAALWRHWPRPAPDDAEVVTVLVFEEVARSPVPADAGSRSSRSGQRDARGAARSSQATSPSPAQAASSPGAPPPLDLRLPPPAPLPIDNAASTFLEHAPAIDYQRTRYEQGWVSEGNLTHVAARRSKAAAVVLSVLGALVEPCTDDDKAHYRRGCTPDAYRHDGEAALRDAGFIR